MTKLKPLTSSTKSFQYLFDQYNDTTFHECQFKQTSTMSRKVGYLITYVDKTNEHIDAPSAAAAHKIAIAKKAVKNITYNAIDTPAIA